ncbi:12092_t:CDS:2, partial [Gigaspora margarita]
VGSTIPSNITSIPLPEPLQDDIPGNISQSCKNTFATIFFSPAFTACLPIGALLPPLLPLISEIGNIKTNPRELLKYLDPIDEFSDVICSASKCADKDIQGAIQDIEDGCKADLNNNNTFAELILVLSLPDSPINITGNAVIDAIAVADPEQVCTRCNKDIINTFGNFIKNNTLALQVLAQAGINQTRIDTMKIGVAVKCGIKFEDGEVPDHPPQ